MLFGKYLIGAFFMLCAAIAAAESVNINDADAQALASLKGVGPAKAAAIIADRDANGPFSSVEDLMRVRGIGEKTVETNKDMMTVGEGSE